MKDAFNVNDFLGILEQGVKINKRREDKEASVKKVSSKETAPSLEDLFEASEPIETFVNPVSSVEDSESSDGFKIIDVDDYEYDFDSHQNISDDKKVKNSDVEISKNGAIDELSKKDENVKNGADVPFSYEERACSEEDNSDFSADIEISKRTAEKSILKNENSNLDVKNSSSPTLEPVFESVFDDVVSEVEPVKKDNLDSNISYSRQSGVQPVDTSSVVIPSVVDYSVAISEEHLEPCVLYSAENESWHDECTDFEFEESESSVVDSVEDEDFDVEYEGESELDEMDEDVSVSSPVASFEADFDEDDEEEEDEVSTDIYDVDFDDEDDEDDEFDDYEDDDSESIVSESDDIYDVDDFDDDEDYVDEEEEEEYLDDSDYEEPAPEYDFSESKSASDVFGNVDFEGGEPSAPTDITPTDEDIDEMETDFDIEEDDLEDEPTSIPVKSVSPEDEMDVESSHRVKSKPAPVYKSFDDDDDDEFTRRAFERAMGSRVQAKINVDESKKEDVVISDSFEEVVSDETTDSVVSVAEEQVEQSVKEKPSVSPKLDSPTDSAVESPSKSLGIRDVSEPEKEEPAVKFEKGMSLKDFLRENPTIRQEEEVLKFFSKADIVQAERRSQIMIRRGKIIL